MNLQENINRIKEVMGINNTNKLVPVSTNQYVYHKSNPIFRKQIEEMGLIPKGKSETWLSDTPIEGKVIFATNSDNEKDWFDSPYDDDIYRIDTTKINNTWYKDPNFPEENSKHIITFDHIPTHVIEIIYKGTGNINESEEDDINGLQIINKETYINKYGEELTMVRLDNGKILFKHSDYKDEFIPIEEVIERDFLGNERYMVILSRDEKEFVNNFLYK